MIPIQANISGYTGKPITVLAGYDEESGILVVSRVVPMMTRFKKSVLISNDKRGDRDSLFTDEQLKDSITGYYHLKGEIASDGISECLRFGDNAAMSDPVSVIENDGVDVSGPRYRIAPDASNAHIAALAICRYVSSYGSIEDTVGMADDMFNLLSGAAVTI